MLTIRLTQEEYLTKLDTLAYFWENDLSVTHNLYVSRFTLFFNINRNK